MFYKIAYGHVAIQILSYFQTAKSKLSSHLFLHTKLGNSGFNPGIEILILLRLSYPG